MHLFFNLVLVLGFAKLDETKISPLTLKQIETDKKLKDEINRFHDALLQILNELKVKLNEKQTKKMDKVECNSFFSYRSEISSLAVVIFSF